MDYRQDRLLLDHHPPCHRHNRHNEQPVLRPLSVRHVQVLSRTRLSDHDSRYRFQANSLAMKAALQSRHRIWTRVKYKLLTLELVVHRSSNKCHLMELCYRLPLQVLVLYFQLAHKVHLIHLPDPLRL